MFEQKELDDYLPGEYCVFVRSTHFGDGTKDLSLFSMKEWQYLLELSIVYSEILDRAKVLPEGEGKTELVRSALFFYNCEYCREQSPKEMSWNLVVYNQRQHRLLVNNYIETEDMTYNCFRDWVCANVDKTNHLCMTDT